jgi:cysteine synthase A
MNDSPSRAASGRVAEDVAGLIGGTPLMRLERLFPDSPAPVLAKLELCNPTSIKDRAVLSMIRSAWDAGKIRAGTEVVEASSGNTAIAIASLGAIMGYRARIYMSELASVERRQILCAYGAKVIVTPGAEHTRGARERAMDYCRRNPQTTFFTNQHGNPDNGRAHERTTGPEIWEALGEELGAVVVGLGTSGTFDGLSRFLKARNPDVRVVGFEPAASPVYSGGEQGKHRIIGVGPGFVTENFRRSEHNLDELLLVEDRCAYEWTGKIARSEGILVGPTSGASAWVAGQLAGRRELAGRAIVCFFYDTGERYLTAEGLFPAEGVEHAD